MRKVSFETIGSITAIVVGVAAVAVAWDESRTVRRQQEAAVLPILKIEGRFMNDERERVFSLTATNVGIGPAFIDKGDVRWDGEPVETLEDLRFNVEDVSGSADFWTGNLDGQVLGSGDSLLLYEASWQPEAEGAAEAALAVARLMRSSLHMGACYCSVYDRCWRTELGRTTRPEPSDTCRRD